jgi:ATP-dependent phosphoenolpyruvate carboxykinase
MSCALSDTKCSVPSQTPNVLCLSDIFRAIRRDALLENVHRNDDDTPDYFNVTKTENGRVR